MNSNPDYRVTAWKVVPGVIWIQTRDWRVARTLAKRKDARLVVRGVAGGYLRTFEICGKDLAWAQSLIARLVSANEPFSEPDGSTARDDSETVSTERAGCPRR